MVAFGSDPLDELVIPDGTTVEEHDLVTEGDVIVGGQSAVEFGVRGRSVVAGERVSFGGHIEAEGDCRLDMWCEVADNVLVGEDAYLGERVHVAGELKVAGDLDIGDDVDIEDGFEANGWIVIRNPMPTIVFLFVYLSQLLRIGEEEAAEEMLSALVAEDERDHEPLVVPRNARIGDDAWRVSTPARIGDGCRLHGNVRAESLSVGRGNEIFGSLRAREDVLVRGDTVVSGNVTTRSGDVRLGAGVHVRGDVAGENVAVHRDAEIDGAIRARGETAIFDDPIADEESSEPAAAAGESASGGTDPDEVSDSELGTDGDDDAGVGENDDPAVDGEESAGSDAPTPAIVAAGSETAERADPGGDRTNGHRRRDREADADDSTSPTDPDN